MAHRIFDLHSACGIFFHWWHSNLVAARGIQFPDQGLKPGPPALAAQSLSHWTTREVPTFINKINTQLDLKRKNLTFLILPK